MASENGWEPLHPAASQLEWVTVPGTSVRLQFLKGWASTVLRAFAADFNTHVEPLRDADSAAYTATNSVATSNHLNGTGMDLNWNSHPFRVLNAGFNATQISIIRELLQFYTFDGLQIVWWGNDWNSPKDAMHWNMSYDTWNNPTVLEFINQRIRPDGFSTFRRDAGAATPPLQPALSRTDGYALAVIRAGQKRNISRKGICIALSVPFIESGWKNYANSNVPDSLNYPHDAVGSDHDSTGLFQQRQAWGPLSSTMNPESSAGLFYDGGAAGQRGLTDFAYDSNSRTPGQWAQSVQVSAFPDRYQARWADANALYDRLISTLAPTDPWEILLMSAPFASASHFRLDDVANLSPVEALRQNNAMIHENMVISAALSGEVWAIQLLGSLAAGVLPGSVDGFWKARAAGLLNAIQTVHPEWITAATPTGKAA